jgi:hypothetical protein
MPAERLLPIFEGLGIAVVVCGHTRMQFDRIIGTTRVVNAGSVGKPFGKPGARLAPACAGWSVPPKTLLHATSSSPHPRKEHFKRSRAPSWGRKSAFAD